jgi:hypothetical protein
MCGVMAQTRSVHRERVSVRPAATERGADVVTQGDVAIAIDASTDVRRASYACVCLIVTSVCDVRTDVVRRRVLCLGTQVACTTKVGSDAIPADLDVGVSVRVEADLCCAVAVGRRRTISERSNWIDHGYNGDVDAVNTDVRAPGQCTAGMSPLSVDLHESAVHALVRRALK